MKTKGVRYSGSFIYLNENYMSFVTMSLVNDYEVGARKAEIRSIKQEMVDLIKRHNLKPNDISRKLRELKETLGESNREYKDLCRNIRENFI